jgi:ketosteroid isomerase-like protein
MSQADVEIVEGFEAAFEKGDMDTVMTYIHEDIVVHEAPSLPYPGDHYGHEGLLRMLGAFVEVWEIRSGLDLRVLDGGPNRAVGTVQLDVVAKATGIPVKLRLTEIYTMRDGKIADIEVYYWDTAEIERATGGARVAEGEVRALETITQ